MRPFRQRGGIEIGGFEATWPFATITVEPQLLTVGVLRRVSFTPAEMIAVERFYCIPLFYKGVVIHHRKPKIECAAAVKFFTMGNLDELVRRIADAGFPLGTPPGHSQSPGLGSSSACASSARLFGAITFSSK